MDKKPMLQLLLELSKPASNKDIYNISKTKDNGQYPIMLHMSVLRIYLMMMPTKMRKVSKSHLTEEYSKSWNIEAECADCDGSQNNSRTTNSTVEKPSSNRKEGVSFAVAIKQKNRKKNYTKTIKATTENRITLLGKLDDSWLLQRWPKQNYTLSHRVPMNVSTTSLQNR